MNSNDYNINPFEEIDELDCISDDENYQVTVERKIFGQPLPTTKMKRVKYFLRRIIRIGNFTHVRTFSDGNFKGREN